MKCPFAAPLTKTVATCRHAQAVVRRGGTEIDCLAEPAHARCERIFGELKSRGLAAFGVEDDPTLMPHSVLVKIQTGGLLGLRRLLGDADEDGRIGEIDALLERALAHYGSWSEIPFHALDDAITGARLERRGGRRRG